MTSLRDHLPLTVGTNGFFAIGREMHKLVRHVSFFRFRPSTGNSLELCIFVDFGVIIDIKVHSKHNGAFIT